MSRFTKWYKAIRKSLINAFGGKCGKCKKKLTIKTAQFAHVHEKPTGLDGRGRGGWNRLKDIMMNPSCYWLACIECHADYDKQHGEWRGQKNAS